MAKALRPLKNSTTKLSVQEARFVVEYLIDGNGERSVIDAGWCARDQKSKAARLASVLLKQPRIVNAIAEQMDATAARNLISIDRLMLETYRLATYNIKDAFDENDEPLPMSKLPDDLARVIEGFETEQVVRGNVPVRVVKFKFAKKSVALQMLFEQLLGAVKRLEVTGRNGAPLFSTKGDLSEIDTALLEKIVALSDMQGAKVPDAAKAPVEGEVVKEEQKVLDQSATSEPEKKP